MDELTHDPDLDIVRLAQRRATRRTAMGVLYERFRDRIFNIGYRIVGNEEDARDVLQDVFVLLFRKIHRFRARARFASWIYRVTVNLSLDRLRRKRNSPVLAVSSDLLESSARELLLSAPEHHAGLRDLEEHVQKALQTLSPRLRAVTVLRYIQGLSYQEIAEVMECSLGTVKSRLNRAHARMRLALGPLYAADADPVPSPE